MKASLLILGTFAAGALIGISPVLPENLFRDEYAGGALYLLLFLVGVSLGGVATRWARSSGR